MTSFNQNTQIIQAENVHKNHTEFEAKISGSLGLCSHEMIRQSISLTSRKSLQTCSATSFNANVSEALSYVWFANRHVINKACLDIDSSFPSVNTVQSLRKQWPVMCYILRKRHRILFHFWYTSNIVGLPEMFKPTKPILLSHNMISFFLINPTTQSRKLFKTSLIQLDPKHPVTQVSLMGQLQAQNIFTLVSIWTY